MFLGVNVGALDAESRNGIGTAGLVAELLA